MALNKVSTYCQTTPTQHDRRRGAMLVLIAVLLVIFMGMVAFTVDVAYMQMVRTQLRVSTDAAVRASGEALSRTQDLDEARMAAKTYAADNLVAGEPLILDDSDIVPGNVSQQEDGSWVFNASGTPINGLKVSGRRTNDSPSGAVKLFFAQIFNVYKYEISRFAVVVRLDRDICLVVDRSSSMKLTVNSTAPYMSTRDPRFCQPPLLDSRWQALEDAVDVFNVTLASTDPVEYVSLVSYASSGTWCGASNNASNVDQDLTDELALMKSALVGIGDSVFNGGTEISSGIDEAVGHLMNSLNTRPFAAKTMVVLTDGHQLGGRSPVTAAEDAALQGITVHTITFSDGANQSQMQAVAEAGGGNHYHAADEAALEDVFREIALTLPVLLTE